MYCFISAIQFQLEDQFVVKSLAIAEEWDSVFPEQEYIFGDFTERLWAYLTIQQLLDKMSAWDICAQIIQPIQPENYKK